MKPQSRIASIRRTDQLVPLLLTVVVCGALILTTRMLLVLLNLFTPQDILLEIRAQDVLVGLTIYLKTSVDFALLIGNLMSAYNGMKNRIAIEIGTAVGNGAGTLIILTMWTFFKDIEVLLALMITVASLVLFRLAEDGVEHAQEAKIKTKWLANALARYAYVLAKVNTLLRPVLSRIVPHASMKPKTGAGFLGLLGISMTIPFILGLDDFAGYVPLFNIVNVFGFATGVYIGHMILNIFLFLSPNKTIKLVKNPLISIIGSVVFVGLAIWGLHEAYKVLMHH